MTKITVFCGGRGCKSLISSLLRIPKVELNLLVNAYDNGKSTGQMRRYIPGYLGPSDFRKNLSYLLELHSPEQYTLSQLIDFRIPDDFDKTNVDDFISFLEGKENDINMTSELKKQLESINFKIRKQLFEYLLHFFEYYKENSAIPFEFNDCSLGNLIFAGAFFKNKNKFEEATQELMRFFQSKTNANLINVTKGENRFLMGLKANGDILEDEAQIVENQHESKYYDIYLVPNELDPKEIEEVKNYDFKSKEEFFSKKHSDVSLSYKAKEALINSDIIIYGPGTQFSSLFPSYKTKGVKEAIHLSKAKIQVFVMNIDRDNDIQSYHATDLIDSALRYLDEKDNENKIITHVLYNKNSDYKENGVKLTNKNNTGKFTYKDIEFIFDDYEHPVYQGIHNGSKTVKAVLDQYYEQKEKVENSIDIYVDLNKRSIGSQFLIEEFLEIEWGKYFSSVRLSINNYKVPQLILPEYIEITGAKKSGFYSEVEVFKEWFTKKKSKYFVTISGDGEYRMSDIINSIDILENADFGAVYGSRNQSRIQYLQSLNAAYGESRFVFYLSRMGAMLLGVFFAIRFRIFFSDPLTGFRIYSRRILTHSLKKIDEKKKLRTSIELNRHIVKDRIEIAETPVRYRTFKGFTNVNWRIMRGLLNLKSIFF